MSPILLSVLVGVVTATLPPPVEAEARAVVVQGRQAEARARALQRALREAVAAAARRAHPELAPQMQPILARTYARYAASYRILEEGFKGRGRMGSYHVRLQVDVDWIGLARLADEVAAKERTEPAICVELAARPSDVLVPLRTVLGEWGLTCARDAQHRIHVDVSCRSIGQGPLPVARGEARFGATVACEGRAAPTPSGEPGLHVQAQAAGLGRDGRQAEIRARTLAAIRLARLMARALEARRPCRRSWLVDVSGATPAALLSLARQLARRYGAKGIESMTYGNGAGTFRILAPRCFRQCADVLEGVALAGFDQEVRCLPGRVLLRLQPVQPNHETMEAP